MASLARTARSGRSISVAEIDKAGFNLFVIGPNGARMQEAVKAVLEKEARTKPPPSDWIYVNNFLNADKPIAIELPASDFIAAALVRSKRMSVSEIQLLSSAGISAAFMGLQERLVVIARGAFDETVSATIASIRRVPILIIEAVVDGS